MDISVLTQYFDIIVVGICLCVGYMIKTGFDKIPNKYIPLIVGTLGLVIKVAMSINAGINAEVVLSGLFSGLASTGLYEAFKNIIGKEE
jgi:hypothetical protein